ncbi:MAG: cupin domain-containing protein [Gammaproteobacteria bacterium]|nr:cupin domain-containing protein [Gammaproteobacteria bacterium]
MTQRAHDSVLGGLAVEEFLKKHWQKKPLLIRNAFPDFETPLSADELAGLACEDGIESRVVINDSERYELRQGPFSDRDFAELPEQGWTLLVQDVDKHLPDLADFLEHFNFIPNWRIDDLMISYAAEGGGVGPHTDQYDVFLLQAAGKRRWQVAESFDPSIIEGIDLKVLKTFTPEADWVLEPGDMLYLPPGVAHDGVALDSDCMTWSIGFRAPALQDMISDFVELVQQRVEDDTMYSDADLSLEDSRDGKLSDAGLKRARDLLRSALEQDDAEMNRWFGRFVTEPKAWLATAAPEDRWSPEALKSALATQDFERDSRSRMTWLDDGENTILFIDGDAWTLEKGKESGLDELLGMICTRRLYPAGSFGKWLDDDAAFSLLLQLADHGALKPVIPGDSE